MKIQDTIFETPLIDILAELQSELRANGSPYIQALKDTGEDIMVSCPFHKGGLERRPSMGIRKTDGLCHCFTCGTTVSLPEFISHCFGHDPADLFGWNWLLKNFLTVSIENRKLSFGFDNLRAKAQDTTPEYVTEEELDKYRYYHPYWTKRKITNEQLIELFDLGYDRETNCITMPVRDKSGRCLFIARRSVQTKYFNYPKGVEKPLYGLYEYLTDVQKSVAKIRTQRSGKSYFLERANEVIVCESIIDALTCWQYGKYAVALNGTGTKRQYEELMQMPCRKLILATDADKAGMNARKKLRENVRGKIITEYLWDLSIAKDINDMDKAYFDSLEEVF